MVDERMPLLDVIVIDQFGSGSAKAVFSPGMIEISIPRGVFASVIDRGRWQLSAYFWGDRIVTVSDRTPLNVFIMLLNYVETDPKKLACEMRHYDTPPQ